MRRHPRLALWGDFFLPNRYPLLQFIDDPAAGFEGRRAMFGTRGNEDDRIAGPDHAKAMHDARINQRKTRNSFVAKLLHFRERHAVVGVETYFADFAAL